MQILSGNKPQKAFRRVFGRRLRVDNGIEMPELAADYSA
jgi:hypothetical protein